MSRENRKSVIWNIGTLFIQEFFILISLFTVIRIQDSITELYFLFELYTCIKVYAYTGVVLLITGCCKYAKGLIGILFKKELIRAKDGQNVLFFLKTTSIISIVVNLIFTSISLVTAGDDLGRVGVEWLPYVFPHKITHLGCGASYGLLLIVFLLPIYIRVKMVMDQAEESKSQ